MTGKRPAWVSRPGKCCPRAEVSYAQPVSDHPPGKDEDNVGPNGVAVFKNVQPRLTPGGGDQPVGRHQGRGVGQGQNEQPVVADRFGQPAVECGM